MIEWVIGTNRETGDLFIATADGNRVDLPIDAAPHLAAALAEHCSDPDERAFVSDEWGPLWD